MIKFENTEVVGWEAAIRGMRNPMNSWEKSDSRWFYHSIVEHSKLAAQYIRVQDEPEGDTSFYIGSNDKKLMMKLRKAGTDHRKFMRMVVVYTDITAPLYWWSEYDTYKVGTVANSTSKMHKMLAKPFEMNDFSFDYLPGYKRAFIPNHNNLPEVNHISGNKMDNSVSNLEWVTRSENQQHAVINHLQPKGLSTYAGKFTADQREVIKNLWNSGKYTRREIAKIYGVSHTCINDIINNKYQYATKVNVFETVARPIIDTLNELRDSWLREEDVEKKKQIWYSILQLLPVSYNQRRTVMLNYEVLANIYESRKNHKLDEWSVGFMDWIKTLPYSELITGGE